MALQFSPSGYRKTGGDGFEDRVFTGAAATNCTFAMWLRRDVDQNTYGTYWSVQGVHYLALITGSNGDNMRLDSNYESSGLDAQNDPTGFLPLVTGTWYYVAITLNGTASTLYYATLGDTTLTTADTWTASTGTPDFTDTGFGTFAQFGVQGEGSLAFYRSWTQTLSQAQLEAEMVSTTPVVTSGLWHDYRFASGQLGEDSSGNNYDTSFTGGTGGSFTADPSFSEEIFGTASADFTFAGPATGTVTAEEVFGTATADFVFTAPVTGTVTAEEVFGTATADFVFSASADGTVSIPGAPTATADFTFAATATGQVRALNVYEAIAMLCRESGRDVYVGEAGGEVEVPYAVVSMDWEPEPDIGQVMVNRPSMQRISVQINSYGRANKDALWLDSEIYTRIMEPVAQIPGHRVVWWDGDESPVLTRTRYGLILCKHWYRLVYTREGV